MALSAEVENFDYKVQDGTLRMVDGPSAEVSAQLFELVTNQGEWFLGPGFGYPWIVKNRKGENVGLLGTVFNSGYTTSILSEKLSSSEGVLSIESVELLYKDGQVTGNIRELLDDSSVSEYPDSLPVSFTFSFGGDL